MPFPGRGRRAASDGAGRGVRAAEAAALHRVGLQVEQRLDLVGGHRVVIITERTAHARKMVTYESAVFTAIMVPGLPGGQAVSRRARHGYTEIDVDADPAASAEVMRRVGKRAIPQLVIDGEWFQPYKPGRGLLLDELHERLGIPRA